MITKMAPREKISLVFCMKKSKLILATFFIVATIQNPSTVTVSCARPRPNVKRGSKNVPSTVGVNVTVIFSTNLTPANGTVTSDPLLVSRPAETSSIVNEVVKATEIPPAVAGVQAAAATEKSGDPLMTSTSSILDLMLPTAVTVDPVTSIGVTEPVPLAVATTMSTPGLKTGGRRNATNCQCGVKRSGQKIAGGTMAQDGAWPWLAALVYVGDMSKPKQFCGGSLINDMYILTAAHCLAEMEKMGFAPFRIYLGTNLINGPRANDKSAVKAEISSMAVHPNYNKNTLNADIALLRLTNPVTFSDSIQPICLSQNGAPHIGKTGIVAGWGSLSTGSSAQTVNALRNVNVKVVENRRCATDYAKARLRITPAMLCAALPKKDACKGDSGGPLFAKRGKASPVFDQLGVVSFGQNCAKKIFPGVYTRVGKFLDWIKQNTRDAVYCSFAFSGRNQ